VTEIRHRIRILRKIILIRPLLLKTRVQNILSLQNGNNLFYLLAAFS